MKVVIAAGTGRYGDPWHPFVETSKLIEESLIAAGHTVVLFTDVDASLQHLEKADALLVNAGDPWRNGVTAHGALPMSTAGLAAALDRGIGIVALHNAVSSLRDYPRWKHALGGEWVAGVSWHPERSAISVPVTAHPASGNVTMINAIDELYTDLSIAGDAVVLASHLHEGIEHPLLWAREYGAGRAVVSTFGHDETAYVPETLTLVTSAVEWVSRQS